MPALEKPTSLVRSVAAAYISITQVTCTLPEVKDGVYVSVSNNGQGYSNDWYLHTAYDSVCFDCDLTSTPVKYTRKVFIK